mgnify:CR=1 FL=1
MHVHSSAVLRELHLQKEQKLRRAELAKQMEFAHRVAQSKTGARRKWLATVFGRLVDRLPERMARSPRPLEPSNP